MGDVSSSPSDDKYCDLTSLQGATVHLLHTLVQRTFFSALAIKSMAVIGNSQQSALGALPGPVVQAL